MLPGQLRPGSLGVEIFILYRHRAAYGLQLSAFRLLAACDHCNRTAARRSLVLGASRNVDRRSSDYRGYYRADRGARVPGRIDVRVVEHGMACFAHQAVRARFGLGENIDDALGRRIGIEAQRARVSAMRLAISRRW